MNRLVQLLLNAPDTQLDRSMVELVKRWSDPPKAIEILEVLDKTIYSSLASDMVVTTLRIAYESACKSEGVTHHEMAVRAHWRNR